MAPSHIIVGFMYHPVRLHVLRCRIGGTNSGFPAISTTVTRDEDLLAPDGAGAVGSGGALAARNPGVELPS